MIVSTRAVTAVSTVTGLEEDLSKFLVEEMADEEDLTAILSNEERMASLLGEHLVNFGVCESESLSWLVCDKIIQEFRRRDVPTDLLHYPEEDEELSEKEPGLCPICGRQMPLTFHHLLPKSTHKKMIKRGYDKVELNSRGVDVCRPCHSQIHRLIPLMEMAEQFNTLEAILSHKGVQKWIPYIRKQKLTSKSDKRVNAIQHRILSLPEEDFWEDE